MEQFSLSSDSDGKQLSKEQQDYFKDSKMRDDNGNLKVMYHGSQDAGFHVFDPAHSDDETSPYILTIKQDSIIIKEHQQHYYERSAI